MTTPDDQPAGQIRKANSLKFRLFDALIRELCQPFQLEFRDVYHILFLADLESYRQIRESISGRSYSRARWSLMSQEEDPEPNSLPCISWTIDTSELPEAVTDHERAVLCRVLDTYRPHHLPETMTAREVLVCTGALGSLMCQLLEESIQASTGWRLAAAGGCIPYHTAAAPDPGAPVSEAAMAHGAKVEVPENLWTKP